MNFSGLLTVFQVSNFAPKSDSSQQPVTNDSPMLQHEFFNSQFKNNNILLSQLQKIYAIKIYNKLNSLTWRRKSILKHSLKHKS